MADEDKPALLAKEPEAAETVVEPVDPAQLPEPEPDLATEAIPVPPPVARPARGGGVVAPVFGGFLAAALGFGLSHFNVFGLRADQDPAALDAALTQLGNRIGEESQKAAAASQAALDQADAALKTAQSGATGLTSADEKLTALGGQIAALERQVAAQAAAMPDGSVPPAAFAALKADLDALTSVPPAAGLDAAELRRVVAEELDARAAEVAAAAEKEAEATRQAAAHDAALISLQEAVKNGQPWQDALAALGENEVPSALAAHAATGVPSVVALAESFPEAARVALEASLRADGAGTFGDRALSLLRIGTGARSLTPQEGSDPDAILSRAEAAVKTGDLAAALTELQGLPPEGQSAMAPWIAQAQGRIDAEAALAALKP